ncbi:MAG: ATP-binding protein [Caldilineaceae bacterium]|nr:ATP-binding protein [Caldilineaceae bacterium]
MPIWVAAETGVGCECRGTGYLGWKTPIAGYPLGECQFCACAMGAAALAHWRRKAAEEQQRRLDRLFSGAGVPRHFQEMTIETLVERAGDDKAKAAAIAVVREYIDTGRVIDPVTRQMRPGIIIAGRFGAGKTGLLTPALRHALGQGKSGLWIECADFISDIQAGYATGDSHTRLETAQRADVVLLDDLGDVDRERAETEDRRRILYQLINYRHNNCLPMLISTNCAPAQLAMQFGARTFERLAESCAWVEMGGANLRRPRGGAQQP